ncbi:MAG: cytochrome c [Pirellulaceae bacterium]|nr:cytochrome c [Pirellulaceae bacterium]
MQSTKTMTFKKKLIRKFCAGLGMLSLLIAAGCRPSTGLEFPANEVELLKLQRHKYGPNEELDSKYKDQVAGVMAALFGTPDEPAFPFPANDASPFRALVSLGNLNASAGPVASVKDGKENLGLYRKHCANCHGLAGDGAGPVALTLNPYPRDFRLGKFKFKSTPLRVPPTDEDLVRVIRHGIPGTGMPAFPNMPPDEMEAIVDYVKYLAIRGEVERRLWDEVTSLAGEPLAGIPGSLDTAQTREAFRKVLVSDPTSPISDILFDDVLPRWVERDARVSAVPTAPAGVEPNDAEFNSLAGVGKELFLGKANCIQCHELPGHSATQAVNYDDWTNDWVKTPGIDVEDKRTFREFLKAGALPPRLLRPRNLTLPVYRGGDESRDLYLRIKNGIEGTPMPSSVSLNDEEIWALVAFVRSMPLK